MLRSLKRLVSDPIVGVVLALGILPSLTNIGLWIRETIPSSRQFITAPLLYGGPINFLKLATPILLIHAWTHRDRISPHSRKVLLVGFILGTFATLVSGSMCQFPPMLFRQWFIVVLGMIAATSFIALSLQWQKRVILFWAAVIYGSALLDLFAPSVVDWLYQSLFDPSTRALDYLELGDNRRILSGIFGKQSMAKFLAWTPWLLLFWFLSTEKRTTRSPLILFLVAISVVSTAATLATTQRGPFVGALAGWLAFGMHQWLRVGNRKIAVLSGVALVVSVVATLAIVPRPILETRIRSLIGRADTSTHMSRVAEGNKNFRILMAQLSFRVIASHPMGHACIPESDFRAQGIYSAHAHHIWIHQFRERGWFFGLFHLAVWMMAWIGAWRLKSMAGSALLAGLTATLMLGQFDQPWSVLNHSLMLGIYLLIGLERFWKPSLRH